MNEMEATAPTPLLPWFSSATAFLDAAANVESDGACCTFVVDPSIPARAREGYAALVMAFTRTNEPVAIVDGAAVLLITAGGTGAAQIAAQRVLDQLAKLNLEQTLRTGIAALTSDINATLQKARHIAERSPIGAITVAV